MCSREDAVLNMQITLIQILAKAWKVDLIKLSEIFSEYSVLSYIDVCYEYFNSTGIKGVIEDIEEYIEMQGGSVR